MKPKCRGLLGDFLHHISNRGSCLLTSCQISAEIGRSEGLQREEESWLCAVRRQPDPKTQYLQPHQPLPWLRSSTCISSGGASCISDGSWSDRPHGSILRYHFSNISTSVRSRALVWLQGGGGQAELPWAELSTGERLSRNRRPQGPAANPKGAGGPEVTPSRTQGLCQTRSFPDPKQLAEPGAPRPPRGLGRESRQPGSRTRPR